MQNKGAIRAFAILFGIICFFYMTFTYVTRSKETEAKAYGEEFKTNPTVLEQAKLKAAGNAVAESAYIDSVCAKKRDLYIDSLRKTPVYNLLITSFTYEDCKDQEINLGLDLQGGMNVTLEVSVADIIKGMSNNSTDENFNKAIAQAREQQKTSTKDFVTLFGEAFKTINPNGKLAPIFQTIELKGKIDFNTKDVEVLSILRERVEESISTAENTLRARIDKFGVTQPNIQKLQGSGRILVELPGVSDKERVRKLLQGTANLEFWETYENQQVYLMMQDANKLLADILYPAGSDSSATDSTKTKNDSAKVVMTKADSAKADTTKGSLAMGKPDSTKKADADTSIAGQKKKNPLLSILTIPFETDAQNRQLVRKGPVVGWVAGKDTAKVNQYLSDKRVRSAFPSGRIKFLWSFKASKIFKGGDVFELVAIKITSRDGKSPLSGDIITGANKEFDRQGGSGSPNISMTMTQEAGQVWRRLTGDNIGHCIAIVLDDKVYSNPTVQGEIAGGRSSITGDFSIKEADDLVNILKAGKLPAPARIVEETVVGPTLGEESITNGLKSFVIALIVVLLFMGFYYSTAGWVANVALFCNVFFVMGVLASLSAVLTLPGIAGIVLTIGMSVDANILIFERIREELASGKGIGMAIKEGFANALSSILDSNITTLLLGIILFVFGTGPIQGFATTLIIGILTSLFCAIFISRLIFETLLGKEKPIAFSIPMTASVLKNINIDFVGKRKLYYIFSGSIILLGCIFFFKNHGFNLGVDFKGGRSYVVRFDQEKSTEDVKKALTLSFGDAPEVKTYGESTQQRITTTYLIDDNSEDAEAKVDAKLREGLDKTGTKYQVMSSQKVGETISRDIKSKAVYSILFSCLVMFLYIFIRFKKMSYGLGAVAALFHDVLIVLSFYTIFDGLLPFSLEIDQHFVAAVLTVMGYSMTDTVVVFDRIREYLSDKGKDDLDKEEKHGIINYALNSTLSRTILTSLTIFMVLLMIFIFGGETIKGFSFALLIGIVIGTYSSICIATPIVIDFDKKEKNS